MPVYWSAACALVSLPSVRLALGFGIQRLATSIPVRAGRLELHFPGTVQAAARRFVSMTTSNLLAAESMAQRLVWVDLEGPNLIINQPDALLDGMSDWCKEHHGDSGLTRAVQESKISLQQAEYEFLSFIRQHTPPGLCPLAGNSVHADKKFLDKYMPQFMYHLHYRIIDVSTIKELCRALDDIHESIKELQFYRRSVFKPVSVKKHRIVENGENGSTDLKAAR
ncbi:ORN protein, partial [Polypterus senegalus]